MFSKNAVICQRDGVNCLLFRYCRVVIASSSSSDHCRVGNMRLSTLVEAHVRAILISKKVTAEGEVMPYAQTELSVCCDQNVELKSFIFVLRSEQMLMVKKMNSSSSGLQPWYTRSTQRVHSMIWAPRTSWRSVMRSWWYWRESWSRLATQSRSMSSDKLIDQLISLLQARSSYLPNEVLWGYRFANLLTFKHSASEYKIDYSAFNSVYKTELTPLSQRVKAGIMTSPS